MPNSDRDPKQHLIHCWWECRMISPVGKTVWLFLIKLNAHLLCDSAVPLLVLHPRETKAYIHSKKKKKSLHRCVYSSLFAIIKNWNNPDLSHWVSINKLWYIHTMEHPSAMKKE